MELGMDLKKLLQYPDSEAFKGQISSEPAIESGRVTGAMLSESSGSRAGEANSER